MHSLVSGRFYPVAESILPAFAMITRGESPDKGKSH